MSKFSLRTRRGGDRVVIIAAVLHLEPFQALPKWEMLTKPTQWGRGSALRCNRRDGIGVGKSAGRFLDKESADERSVFFRSAVGGHRVRGARARGEPRKYQGRWIRQHKSRRPSGRPRHRPHCGCRRQRHKHTGHWHSVPNLAHRQLQGDGEMFMAPACTRGGRLFGCERLDDQYCGSTKTTSA